MTLQTKTSFKTFFKVLIAKVMQSKFGRIFLSLLFISLVDLERIYQGTVRLDMQFLSLSSIVFLIATTFLFLLVSHRLFQSIPRFQELVAYSFTEQGVYVRGESFEFILGWNNIKLEESSGSFILTQSDLNWFIIPKSQISSDLSSLRTMLDSRSTT